MAKHDKPAISDETPWISCDGSSANGCFGATHRLPYGGEGKERLDQFIVRSLPTLSRSQVRKFIISGFVTLNGENVKAGSLLHPGDLVEITIPPSLPSKLKPDRIPLDILYDDEWLLAVNKPPGMVVQPGPGHTSKTLVHALLALHPALDGVGGPQRAGLVHRLDKDTSGVMVVAKTEDAHRLLTDQFKGRQAEKSYLTLVHGRIKDASGTINLSLGRHVRDRKKISTRTRTPRTAVTHWQVLLRLPHCTLLRVRPETGRTHQIRVHLATVNHPVVGDPLYGGRRRARRVRREDVKKALLSAPRQFLHAESLSIRHPAEDRTCFFRASLPTDLMEILSFFGIDDLEEFDTSYGMGL